MGLFIPVDDLTGFQLTFLFFVYGYILLIGSEYISDGSELLLLVPSFSKIVGSCVLPVLGAVPDSFMILFSGLGSNAQTEIEVGVGALAGSTIMLLTIPWTLSVIAGRVNLVDGKATYKRPKGHKHEFIKLSPPGNFDLFETGVEIGPMLEKSGRIMMITSLSYFLIQGAAFSAQGNDTQQAKEEKYWALVGFLYCMIAFGTYLFNQYRLSQENEHVENLQEVIRQKTIKDGSISLLGVIAAEVKQFEMAHGFKIAYRNQSFVVSYGAITNFVENGEEKQEELQEEVETEENEVALNTKYQTKSEEQRLIQVISPTDEAKILKTIENVIRPFFDKYDKDGNGTIEIHELAIVMHDMGEYLSQSEIETIFKEFDKDGNQCLDIQEFSQGILEYVIQNHLNGKVKSSSADMEDIKMKSMETEPEEDDDEYEEIPEDLRDLSPEAQQFHLKLRSAWMMLLGTFLVFAFSDPMVDVLDEIGERTGISSFYISFILSPLASNASELIASYNYALKKTGKTITISTVTLIGASIMNNTLGLGIFLGLVTFRGLAWQFSAETISILVVEITMFFMTKKTVHRTLDGLIVLSLYPLSLSLVAILENGFGLN